MSIKRSDHVTSKPTVQITYQLQDPHAVTGKDEKEVRVLAPKGASLLEVAMDNGINIEHACGGVCACSTCHIFVKSGMDDLSEAQDAELDRVDEAPGNQRNSRLACQSLIEGDGPIVIEVPAWNRNAVKEKPH